MFKRMGIALFLLIGTALALFYFDARVKRWLLGVDGAPHTPGETSAESGVTAEKPRISPEVWDALNRSGSAEVIVLLKGGYLRSGRPIEARVRSQKQAEFDAHMKRAGVLRTKPLKYAPAVVLIVNAKQLPHLLAYSELEGVYLNRTLKWSLQDSTGLMGMPPLWSGGKTGAGRIVAVIDTGVDSTNHPFSVAAQACFSTTSPPFHSTVCPNGQDTDTTSSNAGMPCDWNTLDPICMHGTHVAGIAAGLLDIGANLARDSVAPGAQIIAIKAATKSTHPLECGGGAQCAVPVTADLTEALNYIITLPAPILTRIDVINLSVGAGLHLAACDMTSPHRTIIDNLRNNFNIATVVATGNDGDPSRIADPSCVSTAISVGNTTKVDAIYGTSNRASFMSLWAPGTNIDSAQAGGGVLSGKTGTSMSAPHVAGCIAVLRQQNPSLSVTAIASALASTGMPISGSPVRRVDCSKAFAALQSDHVEAESILKICKIAGTGISPGTSFSFKANGLPIASPNGSVPSGPPPGGYCVVAGKFPTGSKVEIEELHHSGTRVSSIAVAPKRNQTDPENLRDGQVAVTMSAGVTEVTYTNESTSGFIEVCKIGKGVSGNHTFDVAGQTITVPAGACSPAIVVASGPVTIREIEPRNARMTGVCYTIPRDRQISCDPATRISVVTVVPGDISTMTVSFVENEPNKN